MTLVNSDVEPGSQMRSDLWQHAIKAIESYASTLATLPITPRVEPADIRSLLKPFDFARQIDPKEAIDFVVGSLMSYQTHTAHKRFFGLFDPATTTIGIIADALAAAFNPQLAAWRMSPFPIEMEQHLVRAFAGKFGYEPELADGTFTSGGAEANQTALLTALTARFPTLACEGLRALTAQPIFYLSSEGHHSFVKAARASGLGMRSLRIIPVNDELQMDVDVLSDRIAQDRNNGLVPFMIVATAGTTNAGVIDHIEQTASIAASERVWLHVDAAWGGAVTMVPELRHLFAGIEKADSITFDPHKWFSVPRGAGLYLTRHLDILERTFHVATAYAPRKRALTDAVDPFAHSMQWSRRFIGLKVFLSLAVIGWDGYAAAVRHQLAMGDYLREQLESAGWSVVNKSSLAVICFFDGTHLEGDSETYLESIAEEVVSSGQAWISTTRIGDGKPVLRACVTNHRTGVEDVLALIQTLSQARVKVAPKFAQACEPTAR